MRRVQPPRARRWPTRVPIPERGPGESYRPEHFVPSMVGPHQPGIATKMLDRVAFGALDVTACTVEALTALMKELTAEAEALMTAVARRGAGGPLTVTLGLGPGLLGDRFGLASRRPVALRELPAFPGDELDPMLCGGDLCVQACAPHAHDAADALARMVSRASGSARLRWSQDGFVHRATDDRRDGRPRNLLGFHDGVNNPRRGKDFERHVWVARGDRTWMVGGTFLVVRRIELRLDAWEALSTTEQERIIGRRRDTGAPLGATHEFDRLPLEGDDIAPDAHVRLAAARTNQGAAMLRRAYSYDNGPRPDDTRDAGLLLLTYQRDPRRQFVPVQRRLAAHDALSRFSRPIGSAVFAIPPGRQPGGFIADQLLADAVPTARTSAR
jgi:deferrochelatase/peroxidase EfeB